MIEGKDGSDRIRITSGTYTAKYRDGDGVMRERATGCRQKDTANSVLKQFMDEAEKVRAGVITTQEVETADHGRTPITKHFEDYLVHMRSRDISAEHIRNVTAQARKVFADCRFETLKDISREGMERWLANRKSDNMGARTRITYLQAVRGFCGWCVASDRLAVNPVAKVERADERIDCRRKRRSLTEVELGRLLEVARWRPIAEYGRETVNLQRNQHTGRRTWRKQPITLDNLADAVERAKTTLADNQSFSQRLNRRGRERALIYKTLVLTGLRRGELASLKVGHLSLDADPAYVILDPKSEKNREGSSIPLREDLASDLRQWTEMMVRERDEAAGDRRGNVLGDTPLFSVPRKLVCALNRDLAAAGIPKVDDRGQTVDVHALRHSFCTLLSSGGVSPRTAQQAMRHSNINLTMQTYTDPRLLDVHGALDALPSLALASNAGVGETPFAPEFAPTLAHPGLSATVGVKKGEDSEADRKRA